MYDCCLLVAPSREHLDSVFGPILISWLFLISPFTAAPTSPRQIKSYHLIDFSALESPQPPKRANSPQSFKSSLPTFSSLLESQEPFNTQGRPTFTP